MTPEIAEVETAEIDPLLEARRVARRVRKAAIATIAEDGAGPYVSLAILALDYDLAPILYFSSMAQHTRNLVKDPRISLLLDGTDGFPNPQAGPRVTLVGRAGRNPDARLAARYIARNPATALYTQLSDFAVWRVEPEKIHFVGGFGRAHWFDVPFGLTPETARAFAARGDADLGTDIIGIDPDGYDILADEGYSRVDFDAPVTTPDLALALVKAGAR